MPDPANTAPLPAPLPTSLPAPLPAPMIDFATLRARFAPEPSGPRRIIAIAGAPGSGKSTLAQRLVDQINLDLPGHAALLAMDGYHYDDILLGALGRHSRKGAPDTFDVAGLEHMLHRLFQDDGATVAVPVFDRQIEIARAGARLIPPDARLIVAEGNYLLLNAAPWSALARFFALTVLVDIPEAVLRDRLTRRWQGFGLPPAAVQAKLDDNDLPNGRFVINQSRRPDYRIGSD